MTGPLIISGVLTFAAASIGSAIIMAVAAWTDANEKLMQWVMHKVWW